MNEIELMHIVQQFTSLIRRPMDRPPGPAHCGHHHHTPHDGFHPPVDDMPAPEDAAHMEGIPPETSDPYMLHMHPGKMRILSILYREDGQTQRDIADTLGIRPPSLSEVLYKMEESGLIERRMNEKDRRQSLVFITEEGRRTTECFLERKDEKIRSFFSPLTEEEKETLSKLLRKLLNN